MSRAFHLAGVKLESLPTVNDVHHCKGVSLIHVLIALAVMTSVMLLNARYAQHRSDSKAIEFTIVQTESLLNGAFSHFQQRTNWPLVSGVCATPFSRLGFTSAIHNGWGDPISCRIRSGRYVAVQRIPAKWAAYVEDVAGGTSSPVSGEPDWVVWEFSVSQYGDTPGWIQYKELENDQSNSGRFTYECDAGSTMHYFATLMGMSVYDYPSVANRDTQFEEVYSGFRITKDNSTPSQVLVRYNMYRHLQPPLGGITESSVINTYSEPTPLTTAEADELDDDLADGNHNANFEIDIPGYSDEPVGVALFSWCTN